MARSLGFPGYQYVTVQHPIASRTEKEIDEMARDALPEIVKILGDLSHEAKIIAQLGLNGLVDETSRGEKSAS